MNLRIGNLEFDHVVYDERADVLYLSAGEPREAARQEATPEGHLVCYDEEGRVIAITIVNAKWLVERDGTIVIPMRAGADDLAPALA